MKKFILYSLCFGMVLQHTYVNSAFAQVREVMEVRAEERERSVQEQYIDLERIKGLEERLKNLKSEENLNLTVDELETLVRIADNQINHAKKEVAKARDGRTFGFKWTAYSTAIYTALMVLNKSLENTSWGLFANTTDDVYLYLTFTFATLGVIGGGHMVLSSQSDIYKYSEMLSQNEKKLKLIKAKLAQLKADKAAPTAPTLTIQ